MSHLFSIKNPDKAPTTARANGLFLAFDGLKGDKAYYTDNLAAIKNNLSKHGFGLTKDDLEKVEYIREMQRKNLIIPIVGDFAGPKAIRKVAEYVKQRNANVSAFYVSNVEVYLEGTGGPVSASTGNPQKLQAFYQNVATLPVDSSAMFIRFIGLANATNLRWWRGGWLQAISPISDLTSKMKAGSKPTYAQALQIVPDPNTLVR